MNSKTKDFIAYEYLSMNVKADKEALYIDCYLNFGWKLINNNGLVDKEDYYINNLNYNKLINLKFKRDRKIPNKAKLNNLQKKCENGLKRLNYLEKESSQKGSIMAITIALIGTVFLSLSVFSILTFSYLFRIIIGIVGLIGWVLSYPVYKKISLKQEEINTPLIEQEYNYIYDACKQAKKILNNGSLK